ncbi:MAG: hypothetical protein IJP31_08760 [Lachnospiraceae bacterium]|nr:hypothetical protein [Lachnospiraceae bacterium]
MRTDQLSNEEIIDHFRQDANKLFRYLPWLKTKSGQSTYDTYKDQGIAQNSIAFPVYDSTLLAFVKEASATCFMDRNHVYVYSRNRLKNHRDELHLIQTATIRDMDQLAGILSHYIMGGRTKALLWSEGVTNGVYLALLSKIKEIFDFWERDRLAGR